jgi:hypothetical protein
MSVGQAYKKWLSPQEQEAVAASCTLLIDAFFDEWSLVESWNPESILATRLGKHLPRKSACNYTPLFLKQFGVCVITVAWKLAQPKRLPLASLAEELAAWAILEEAREVLKRESGGGTEAIPAFQAFIDGYFKDTHVLSLFDPCSDEREEGPLDQKVSPFEDWLLPKASGHAHIPHPYASCGETGTNVGRAYKQWLAPSKREALAAGIEILIDELFEDFTHTGRDELEDMAGTTLAWHLPLHYLPKYTPPFLKQFSVCIMTVAWKLAQPKPRVLSSIAEELATWAILTAAKQHIELLQEEEDEDNSEQTAEDLFEDFVEVLFEDIDFLFLFDDAYDGIETSTVGQMLAMTSLSFADWFRPFNDDPSYMAHPYVFRVRAHDTST